MAQPTRDYQSLIFTPEDTGLLLHKYLLERRANKGQGIIVGLPSLDKIMYPAFPGELVSIIARPGHGKTGFMMRWARTRAAWLRANKIENRAVIYVTLEQSVEELNAFNLAADKRLSITNLAKGEITEAEWTECVKHSVGTRFDPLYNVGHSAMTDRKQIKIDADSIEHAIELIRENADIDIVFVDYLQRISYPTRSESKTIGISDNLDALKTIALQIAKSPLVVGVQARREVDQMGVQIPGLDDGQWTSNIEQTSDRVLSLVRPINYVKDGEMFGNTRVDGRYQLLISVLKQRLGPANLMTWVYFQPEYNILNDLERMV